MMLGFRDTFVGAIAIAVLLLAGDAPSTERRVLVGAWTSEIVSTHRLSGKAASSLLSSRTAPNTRTRRRTMLMQSLSNIQPQWWNKCLISELPYDSALRALEAYHRKHGDLAIPVRFIVPAINGKRNIRHHDFMQLFCSLTHN